MPAPGVAAPRPSGLMAGDADPIHVVCGAVRDDQGRWLVTGRRVDRRWYWEFPGGKRETDEAPSDALRRELDEELGIAIGSAAPLHRVPFAIGRGSAVLDGWLVGRDWHGVPEAREGQPLRWVETRQLMALDWLPPDRPLVVALRLPRLIAITPDSDDVGHVLAAIDAALGRGAGIVVLRLPRLDRRHLAAVAAAAIDRCRPRGVHVLGHGDPESSERLGLDGVHLPAWRVRGLASRPLPPTRWVTAACHDVVELVAAVQLGCDAVLVSPVAPTPSHAGAPVLGWTGFARLAARSPLPAFALGGVGPAELDRVRAHGGFGVAGIRGFCD